MEKLNLESLREIRRQKQKDIRARALSEDATQIIVGMGTTGIAAGARDIVRFLLQEIERRNLTNVVVKQAGGLSNYRQEPLVEVIVPGMAPVLYREVTPPWVERIIEDHVINHKVVTERVLPIDKKVE